jgi:glycosyltransferase involved in cell wall biosynthesis
MKKILCLFDYGCTTGFANVSHNLLDQLEAQAKGKFEFVIVGINYYGKPKQVGNRMILPAMEISPQKDPYGRDAFLKILKEDSSLDGLFIMQDLQVMHTVKSLMDFVIVERQRFGKPFNSIFYFPVDSDLAPSWCKNLESFSNLVTYTKYGISQFKKHNSSSKITDIPHGANFNDFFPLSLAQKKKAKEKLHKGHDFVAITVNRNQVRKDMSSLLQGWKVFLDKQTKYKTPVLYIHANSKDPIGYNLREAQNWLGIPNENIKYADFNGGLSPFSNSELNEIYNSADVFITTTLGEGWGLTVTEAMQTKTPVICPMHTSLSEISDYGKNVWGITDLQPMILPDNDFSRVRERSNPAQVGELILEVSNASKEELHKKTSQAFEKIKQLDWSNVGKTWAKFFTQIYYK